MAIALIVYTFFAREFSDCLIIFAQEGHDPNSGPYEVGVPAEIQEALRVTMGGVDVSQIRVIANSRWANFLSSITEFFTGMFGQQRWVQATTQRNTIYLNSRVSPDQFFRNTELLLHECHYVVNQWNSGRMGNINYLLSPGKWENEAETFASRNAGFYSTVRGM
jgi:hypothetical protein